MQCLPLFNEAALMGTFLPSLLPLRASAVLLRGDAGRRTMCADHFSTMALPVAEFLALEHGTEYSGARAGNDYGEESMVRARLPVCAGALLCQKLCLACGRLLAGLCVQWSWRQR